MVGLILVLGSRVILDNKVRLCHEEQQTADPALVLPTQTIVGMKWVLTAKGMNIVVAVGTTA